MPPTAGQIREALAPFRGRVPLDQSQPCGLPGELAIDALRVRAQHGCAVMTGGDLVAAAAIVDAFSAIRRQPQAQRTRRARAMLDRIASEARQTSAVEEAQRRRLTGVRYGAMEPADVPLALRQHARRVLAACCIELRLVPAPRLIWVRELAAGEAAEGVEAAWTKTRVRAYAQPSRGLIAVVAAAARTLDDVRHSVRHECAHIRQWQSGSYDKLGEAGREAAAEAYANSLLRF